MLKLVPGRVYVGNSAWDIKPKYNDVESKNKFDFFLVLHYSKFPFLLL